MLTRSSRIPIEPAPGTERTTWRGYLFANGKFQFSPEWSLTGSARIASDRTFLRRYDISRDDRLRSTVNLERIDDDSYLSIAGWATQTLRVGRPAGAGADRAADDRLPPPASTIRSWADRSSCRLNSLAITRTDGQDTQRAFAGAQVGPAPHHRHGPGSDR